MATRKKAISAAILAGIGLGLLCLLISFRGSRKFEKKMVSLIDSQCRPQQECLLHLREVTHFQWDKMYVFGYGASESELERVLGTRYRWGGEFQRKIVFTNNGRIVFHEEEPTNVEHPVKDEVAFEFRPGSDYGVYSPDAVFKVSEKQGLKADISSSTSPQSYD